MGGSDRSSGSQELRVPGTLEREAHPPCHQGRQAASAVVQGGVLSPALHGPSRGPRPSTGTLAWPVGSLQGGRGLLRADGYSTLVQASPGAAWSLGGEESKRRELAGVASPPGPRGPAGCFVPVTSSSSPRPPLEEVMARLWSTDDPRGWSERQEAPHLLPCPWSGPSPHHPPTRSSSEVAAVRE